MVRTKQSQKHLLLILKEEGTLEKAMVAFSTKDTRIIRLRMQNNESGHSFHHAEKNEVNMNHKPKCHMQNKKI